MQSSKIYLAARFAQSQEGKCAWGGEASKLQNITYVSRDLTKVIYNKLRVLTLEEPNEQQISPNIL